jgi:hypothetical protein
MLGTIWGIIHLKVVAGNGTKRNDCNFIAVLEVGVRVCFALFCLGCEGKPTCSITENIKIATT